MIFKPSSLHKLFFTYICPRFYGGAPATPSNTTTTSTVNQSPWQNPVYQALMLGTKDKPGPITSMLRSSAEQTAAYNDMLKGGYSPVPNQAQYSGYNAPTYLPNSVDMPAGSGATPTTLPVTALAPAAPTGPNAIVNDGAAKGGIMSLQGYAGGKTATKTPKPTAAETEIARIETKITKKGEGSLTPNEADAFRLNNQVQDSKGTSVLVKVGTKLVAQPSPQGLNETKEEYQTRVLVPYVDQYGSKDLPKNIKTSFPNIKTTAETTASENLKNTIGTSIKAPTADVKAKTDEAGNITGYESTNADFLAIQEAARKLKTPEQYDAATAMYGKSTAGLEAAAGYKPTDVRATKADVANAASQGYEATNAASQGYGATNAASQGYEATNAASQGYGATNAASQGYGATNAASRGYKAADMAAPSNISAKKADVATMQGAGDVSSSQLNQYQMQGPGAINASTAGTSQMAGPASWLDKGTSEAYMNPYMQNVVDIQKREANRDYQQELNKLNAQSVQAGAFGGSRQAIQQAEAARNQATRLGDIEAKGLNEAYTQGASQFNTAQGQGLQAGQANLSASQQSTLANQAAQIQAMMANQGMDYNTAVQNLQAQMGIQNTQAGQDLQAALANQSTQQQTQSTNMAAQNQAGNAYVQQALQAAQANQGAALTTAQANQVSQNAAAQFAANAYNLTSQFNAANKNQASQFEASAANAANLANQQAANQASQFAANAYNLTSQFNAANQNQASQFGASAANTADLANQQAANQASQFTSGAQNTANLANQQAANQASQFTSGAQNTANLANQQAQNTANQQYTTQDLAAQQANQQAGLTANQQGIGALQGVGQNAAGLTNTGTAANQAGLANLGAQGQVAQAEQALSQQGMTNQQQTAQNALDFTNQANAGVVAGVNSQPVQGGTTVGTATAAPASPFGSARGGLIRNGKVVKRGKK